MNEYPRATWFDSGTKKPIYASETRLGLRLRGQEGYPDNILDISSIGNNDIEREKSILVPGVNGRYPTIQLNNFNVFPKRSDKKVVKTATSMLKDGQVMK